MQILNIQFTLFSAFYSPLILTFAGDFLSAEGLQANWSVAPAGESAIKALREGKAELIQTAPSQAFSALDKGEIPEAIHFAQINEMDGFFLTGRELDTAFDWHRLENAEVILFGGGQPLTMFKYACYRAGIDYRLIRVINPGSAAQMDKAFREGQGDFIQQQGPYPQQLVKDGVGHIVAQVGPLIGMNAFSSIAATDEWLRSDAATAFVRAYSRARIHINEAPAAQLASMLADYFPAIDTDVLAECIASYQQLGCWTPHVQITPEALEHTQTIFEYAGNLRQRYRYEQICAPPPGL